MDVLRPDAAMLGRKDASAQQRNRIAGKPAPTGIAGKPAPTVSERA